jgi:hypothetical protein
MFTNSYRKINTIENYNRNKIFDASHILFYSALLFVFMELVLFYYAVIIAKTCSKNKDEFIINIILSIIFTTPYVFFSMMSNPCAKDVFIKK